MSGRIVWLASFPKSGNTWFRAVAVAWRTGGAVDLNRLSAQGIAWIASARSRIESALGVPTSLMTPDEIDLLRPRVDDVIAGRWDRLDHDSSGAGMAGLAGDVADPAPDGTRLSKIHDALYVGPAGEPIVSPSATRAAIYVARDPRDVAVSYAHHYGLTHAQAVAALSDPRLALEGGRRRLPRQVRQRLGTWSQHVQSWLDQQWFPVHVVRYEDCHRDPVPTFTAALRFAGLDAEPDDVARAVDAVRFDRLAAQESEQGFRERSARADRFFRKGEAGSWRSELAPELAARVVRDHHAVMERLGYLEPEGDRDGVRDGPAPAQPEPAP